MLHSDTKPVSYMSDGPAYPGETFNQTMGLNTADALAGHLLTSPIPGISAGPQPGHGYEHEPVDQTERDAQHTTQAATSSLDARPYTIHAPVLDHAEVAGNVRQATRGAGA